jgi:toxin ParE1/3/4
MAGYTLAPLARTDLDEIWTFTVSQWNEEQAERYIREIEATIEAVAAKPNLGRACAEIRPGYFKIPSGSHIIFYRRTRTKIDIVRILHQRMDVGRRL